MPDTTPQPQPAPPPRDAGYGVVEYRDQPGRARFVAWGELPPEALADLCAVARRHGCRPHGTSHFITESRPQ